MNTGTGINDFHELPMLVVNGRIYSYQIKPVEVLNSLGFLRAVLKEYVVTGAEGEIYRLYKTADQSWYDFEASQRTNIQVLHLLKLQIDAKESNDAE